MEFKHFDPEPDSSPPAEDSGTVAQGAAFFQTLYRQLMGSNTATLVLTVPDRFQHLPPREALHHALCARWQQHYDHWTHRQRGYTRTIILATLVLLSQTSRNLFDPCQEGTDRASDTAYETALERTQGLIQSLQENSTWNVSEWMEYAHYYTLWLEHEHFFLFCSEKRHRYDLAIYTLYLRLEHLLADTDEPTRQTRQTIDRANAATRQTRQTIDRANAAIRQSRQAIGRANATIRRYRRTLDQIARRSNKPSRQHQRLDHGLHVILVLLAHLIQHVMYCILWAPPYSWMAYTRFITGIVLCPIVVWIAQRHDTTRCTDQTSCHPLLAMERSVMMMILATAAHAAALHGLPWIVSHVFATSMAQWPVMAATAAGTGAAMIVIGGALAAARAVIPQLKPG